MTPEQIELERYSELRGPYVIEAVARPLSDGRIWHPELTLSRSARPALPSGSQSFSRLKPLFVSAKAAILYAAELGRCLVDEESPLLEI